MLEVDGPTQFVTYCAARRWPADGTLLKRLLLAAAGRRVAFLPYCEWDAAVAGRAARQAEYLSRLLRPRRPGAQPAAGERPAGRGGSDARLGIWAAALRPCTIKCIRNWSVP